MYDRAYTDELYQKKGGSAMRERKGRKPLRFVVELIGIVLGIIYVSPVLIVFINSLKPMKSILKEPFALPKELYLDNIKYVWEIMDYLNLLKNTVLISAAVVIVSILFSSMAGWMLARDGSRRSKVITVLFLSSMLVPFQSFMIPLAKLASAIHITDTRWGYVWVICTLYAPMGVFIYQGFVKNVPLDLEDAARIDGASTLRVFFNVTFPLMKPITASLATLYSIWVWNEYLTALLMLKSESKKTITVAINSFFSIYYSRWDYAITSVAFSVIPITIVFLFMQKYVIEGVTAGAVKG